VQWIGPRNIDCGIGDVWLDGVKVASVDLYAPSWQKNQVLYESGSLPPGLHAIRIVASGKRNPSGIGDLVPVDAFTYAPDRRAAPDAGPRFVLRRPRRTASRRLRSEAPGRRGRHRLQQPVPLGRRHHVPVLVLGRAVPQRGPEPREAEPPVGARALRQRGALRRRAVDRVHAQGERREALRLVPPGAGRAVRREADHRPRIGAAVSEDNGLYWRDLDTVLQCPDDALRADTVNKYFGGGNGDFSVILDERGEWFYFLISTYHADPAEQGVSIARMRYEDRDAPRGKVFKWREGKWESPGIGGRVTPIFPAAVDWHRADADAFWGPSVHYNTHLERYAILMNRTRDKDWTQEGVYISFNPDIADPTRWTRRRSPRRRPLVPAGHRHRCGRARDGQARRPDRPPLPARPLGARDRVSAAREDAPGR